MGSHFYDAIDGFRTVKTLEGTMGKSAWRSFCKWAYYEGGSDVDTFKANWYSVMASYIQVRFPEGVFTEYDPETGEVRTVYEKNGTPAETTTKGGKVKTSKVSPTANAGKTLIGWAIANGVKYYDINTDECLSQSELQKLKKEAEEVEPDPKDQVRRAAERIAKLFDEHKGDAEFEAAYKDAVAVIPRINY
jgi:hypothetical protein